MKEWNKQKLYSTKAGEVNSPLIKVGGTEQETEDQDNDVGRARLLLGLVFWGDVEWRGGGFECLANRIPSKNSSWMNGEPEDYGLKGIGDIVEAQNEKLFKAEFRTH